MIKHALISVYNKNGLEELVSVLGKYNIMIVSSGGTARKIKEMKYPHLVNVEDYTGHPESPEGLLKTLHPRIHGGFLLDPNKSDHKEYLEKHGIETFDMLVSNLYPFEKVTAAGANLEMAAKNIDIGGPTMTRSAAKAALLYGKIAVVTDTSQYKEIIAALEKYNGNIPSDLIYKLAVKAFERTTNYDRTIVEYLKKLDRVPRKR